MNGPIISVESPKLMRCRATDATGLFWGFVCLLIAGFFSLLESSRISVILILACSCCIVWQVYIWRHDAKTLRAVVEWCEFHYPDSGGMPIVDFVLALSHDAFDDFNGISTVTPDTRLDTLVWFPDFDMDMDPNGIPIEIRRQYHIWWLEILLGDARIKGIDASELEGETVDAAIQLILCPKTDA